MSKIRLARKAKGMTLQDLADKTGSSLGFTSKVERGITGISTAKAKLFAQVLDMTPADVIFAKDESAETAKGGAQ